MIDPRYRIPDTYSQHVSIGTCSWKYDSWKGLVYDRGTKYHADDYLVDYSKFFTTVEVDQWFWSLFPGETVMPRTQAVSTYAASVPGDFEFTVKAPNSITLTHFYAKQPARWREWRNKPNDQFLSIELVERFLRALEPLRGRLGPVMFQFEYLNSMKMKGRDTFCEQLSGFLDRLPGGYEYAVETRNPSYLGPEYCRVLKDRGVGTVLLDGYHMPPLDKVTDAQDAVTAPFSVIRLHGPDRYGIEKRTGKVWDTIVEPQDRGIANAVRIVKDNTARNIRTYVNVNNHYEGSAPLTIERFLEALRNEE